MNFDYVIIEYKYEDSAFNTECEETLENRVSDLEIPEDLKTLLGALTT
jgi:hypothetical protein